ncbi:MAG TPA: NAD-dependent epimerase/dehydratase family protein [Vicinamibacterales bacterium]|jgi:nucleoside-diphosphate-sugar epimerase
MSTDRVILVTGGSGFIGSRFAEILCLTGFARAHVGVTSWARAARPARFRMNVVPCDVLDPDQVWEAVQGVDVVVHCAVGDRRVIVDGTRNVLDASARACVSRVIHLSTAEVYGAAVSGNVDETAPLKPGTSDYADAKIDAERLVWESAARGLPITVFRPSIVYGPWSDQWTAALAVRLQSGRWGRYAGYGDGTCNLVYIDDLVAAALASLDYRTAVGQAFNVVGPDVLTWNEYFERFNAALGRPDLDARSARRAKAKSMLTGAVRTTAHIALARYSGALMKVYERGGWVAPVMKRTKAWLTSSPSSSELEQLYSRRAIYDWSKAERLLRYRPAVDLNRGLRYSVDWLRYAGFLN